MLTTFSRGSRIVEATLKQLSLIILHRVMDLFPHLYKLRQGFDLVRVIRIRLDRKRRCTWTNRFMGL